MNTQVINLYAGSGAGKSTTAAGLFYNLKLQGVNCELVTEYVKNLAWQNIKPGFLDQPSIFGQQSKSEANLYGKVDIIITDSPLLLSPIYEMFHNNQSIIESSVFSFIKSAEKRGVTYHHYFLERKKMFSSHGRYETEEKAREIDELVKIKLKEWNIPYTTINVEDDQRVFSILNHFNENKALTK